MQDDEPREIDHARPEGEPDDRWSTIVVALVIVTAPGAVLIATDLSLATIALICLAFGAVVLPLLWLLNR